MFPNEEKALITVLNNDHVQLAEALIEPSGVIGDWDSISEDSLPKDSLCDSLAVSPDKKAIAAVFQVPIAGEHVEKSILIWNLKAREIVHRWLCPDASAVTWSPIDGNLLVGGSAS